MKVLVLGGTGYVGRAVSEELLARQHSVTVASRDPSKVATKPNLDAVAIDLTQAVGLAEIFANYDVVVDATVNRASEDFVAQTWAAKRAVVAAAQQAQVRLLMVGGAGSLYVAPNVQLVDTPEFPAEIKEEATTMRDVLAWLKEQDLDWTMISPQPFFYEGSPFTERTGKIRIAKDEVLFLNGEPSGSSNFDLAIAIVDELENPQFPCQRFTAGY